MKKFLIIISFIVLVIHADAQEADLAKSNAIIAEGQGNYKSAAELYKKAVELYSEEEKSDTFCIFKAGQNFVRIKNYEEGVEFLDKALSLNYSDKSLYLYLGTCYDGLKKHDEAVVFFKKGMELYPEEKVNYLKKLAYHYYNVKNYKEAVSTIDKALILTPGNSKLLYLKGNSLGNLNNYNEAISIYESILSKEPDNKKVISKMGVMIYKKTEVSYKKEVNRYEKMKNPDRIDYHNYRKKIDQLNLGYSKALTYLEKARADKPNDKSILNCLMITYSRLNMKDKANEIKALLD